MKLTSLMPLLRTHNLEQSIAFYRQHLGFACSQQHAEWAFIERDSITVMLALPNAHEPFDKPSFTGSFYFTVDAVDDLWEKLRKSAEVVYPLEDFDYGMREFAIRDNNGYCLQFGQEIA